MSCSESKKKMLMTGTSAKSQITLGSIAQTGPWFGLSVNFMSLLFQPKNDMMILILSYLI